MVPRVPHGDSRTCFVAGSSADASSPRQPSSARRGMLVLGTLLIADALTKLWAVATLRLDAPVDPEAVLDFTLRHNPGLGTWAAMLMPEDDVPAMAGGMVGLLVLTIALPVVWRCRCRRRWKVLLSAGIWFATCVASTVVFDRWPPPVVPVPLQRLVSTAWVAVLWALVERQPWNTALLLLTATGLGNLLSFAYPPHVVVDFAYSAVLHDWLALGTFNLADLYYIAGAGLLTAAILRWAGRWLGGRLARWSRRAATRARLHA